MLYDLGGHVQVQCVCTENELYQLGLAALTAVYAPSYKAGRETERASSRNKKHYMCVAEIANPGLKPPSLFREIWLCKRQQ